MILEKFLNIFLRRGKISLVAWFAIVKLKFWRFFSTKITVLLIIFFNKILSIICTIFIWSQYHLYFGIEFPRLTTHGLIIIRNFQRRNIRVIISIIVYTKIITRFIFFYEFTVIYIHFIFIFFLKSLFFQLLFMLLLLLPLQLML